MYETQMESIQDFICSSFNLPPTLTLLYYINSESVTSGNRATGILLYGFKRNWRQKVKSFIQI